MKLSYHRRTVLHLSQLTCCQVLHKFTKKNQGLHKVKVTQVSKICHLIHYWPIVTTSISCIIYEIVDMHP